MTQPVIHSPLVYPIVLPSTTGQSSQIGDDYFFNSDLLTRPVSQCSWIEHDIDADACNIDADVDAKLIARRTVTADCIEIYVNSQGESGLVDGPEETGDGTATSPYINLNSVTNGCIYNFYLRHCCNFPMVKVIVTGTVDYCVTGRATSTSGLIPGYDYNRRLMLDFSGATLNPIKFSTGHALFEYLNGAVFIGIDMTIPRNDVRIFSWANKTAEHYTIFNNCDYHCVAGDGTYAYMDYLGETRSMCDACTYECLDIDAATDNITMFNAYSAHLCSVNIESGVERDPSIPISFTNVSGMALTFIQSTYAYGCTATSNFLHCNIEGGRSSINAFIVSRAQNCTVDVYANRIQGFSCHKARGCSVNCSNLTIIEYFNADGFVGVRQAGDDSDIELNACSVSYSSISCGDGTMSFCGCRNASVAFNTTFTADDITLGIARGSSPPYYGFNLVGLSSAQCNECTSTFSNITCGPPYGYGPNHSSTGRMDGINVGTCNDCTVTIQTAQVQTIYGLVGQVVSDSSVFISGVSDRPEAESSSNTVYGVHGVLDNVNVDISTTEAMTIRGADFSEARDLTIAISASVKGTPSYRVCEGAYISPGSRLAIRCNISVSTSGLPVEVISQYSTDVTFVDCVLNGSVDALNSSSNGCVGMYKPALTGCSNTTVTATATDYWDEGNQKYRNNGYGCIVADCRYLPEGITASGSYAGFYGNCWGMDKPCSECV